jgi:acyl carrier protein
MTEQNKNNLSENLVLFVARQFKRAPETVSLETSFRDDLYADSLDLVEFVYDFSQEFDVDVPDEAAQKIETVGDALKQLEENAIAA